MIYGGRVRQVREMHRLTQLGLVSEVTALNQSQLSRIEKDLAQPNSEQLAILADYLDVAPEFFERPPFDPLSAHSPQFRSRSKVTQGAKNSALRWTELIVEEFVRLRRRARSIPTRLERNSGLAPIAAATQFRELLDFPRDSPLPYLVLAVERLGVTVVGIPCEIDGLDAFSAWRDDEPIIVLLAGAKGDRLRFSIAHELGHLILHPSARLSAGIEAEADEFAAELLAPLEGISRSLPKMPTLNGLAMLKTHWGVSVRVLIRRARELGVIDEQRSTSLYRQLSARGWNRIEPGYVPREKPRAFMKLMEINYGAELNLHAFLRESGWSERLALRVLAEHARVDELPVDLSRSPVLPERLGEVIPFRQRPAQDHPSRVQEELAP